MRKMGDIPLAFTSWCDRIRIRLDADSRVFLAIHPALDARSGSG